MNRTPLPMHSSMESAPPAASQANPSDAQLAGSVTELSPEQIQELEQKIVGVLRTCYDPEIPVNIHELGLIYGIDIAPTGVVEIKMTLTSPACPVAGSLPPEVEAKVRAIPEVAAARVQIVWDPPWTPERMSEAARLSLGMFD